MDRCVYWEIDMKLKDKVALVTGGGSGIGAGIVAALLAEGAKVAITGRDLAKLNKAASALNVGPRLTCHAADVAKADQVAALVADVGKRLGPIDILINNAGTNLKERAFREMTPQSWDRLIRTNLDGAFYCILAVFPAMAKQGDGVIVNINSISGKRPGPLGGIAYNASKFGMTALGLGLGAEEKESGVRFTNIYPGEVDTPILEFRPQPVSDDHRRKILKPEDVAAAVLYVVTQPPHVHIPELIIKPVFQAYV